MWRAGADTGTDKDHAKFFAGCANGRAPSSQDGRSLASRQVCASVSRVSIFSSRAKPLNPPSARPQPSLKPPRPLKAAMSTCCGTRANRGKITKNPLCCALHLTGPYCNCLSLFSTYTINLLATTLPTFHAISRCPLLLIPPSYIII